MHPILFKCGSISLYSYGACVAVGFILAALAASSSARRDVIAPERIFDLTITALISGILGARLLYVILNPAYYLSRPLEIVDLSRGGLVWYGGFFAGLLASYIYVRIKRLNFIETADFFIPYIALAQSVGRIGCFFNGCCYGRALTDPSALGVVFPNDTVARYPAQLYSSLLLLAIFIALRILYSMPHFKGEIFFGYVILYSVKRFVMESFRGDNPQVLLNLTMSQCVSVVIFAAASILFIYNYRSWKRYLHSK